MFSVLHDIKLKRQMRPLPDPRETDDCVSLQESPGSQGAGRKDRLAPRGQKGSRPASSPVLSGSLGACQTMLADTRSRPEPQTRTHGVASTTVWFFQTNGPLPSAGGSLRHEQWRPWFPSCCCSARLPCVVGCVMDFPNPPWGQPCGVEGCTSLPPISVEETGRPCAEPMAEEQEFNPGPVGWSGVGRWGGGQPPCTHRPHDEPSRVGHPDGL